MKRVSSRGILCLVMTLTVCASSCWGGSSARRPADVVSGLPPNLHFTPDEGLTSPADAARLKLVLNADVIVVGRLDIDNQLAPCQTVLVGAFSKTDKIQTLDALTKFAADATGKDAARFVSVEGVEGSEWPGEQVSCAEAVLAATWHNVFIFATGSPDVMQKFISHLR